uniref:Uncharacterized protein n=1 Tax=Zea mays TaxID=4577 RepID=B6U5E2_MAIZE|nr:hypothetical protein [Zea mays]
MGRSASLKNQGDARKLPQPPIRQTDGRSSTDFSPCSSSAADPPCAAYGAPLRVICAVRTRVI